MNLCATTKKRNVSPEKHSSIPVRNAFSSVRKSGGNGQFGRLKPLRLSELTQEWLEAENEPLDFKQSIEDESRHMAESVASLIDDLADLNIVKSPESRNLNSNNNGQLSNNESMDLGVSWLETPTKAPLSFTIKTPKPVQHIVNSVELATPYNAKQSRGLVTPCNQQIFNKPKILYSTNVKDCLKTPLDRIPEPKSVTKIGTRHVRFQSSGRKVPNQNANEEQTVRFDEQENKENLQTVANNMHSFKTIVVHRASYIILNKLGEGGSSVVYHCYNPETHVECAIKHVKLNNEASSVGYINEVKLLDKLQTCNRIIKLLDYELSENTLLMVLEKGEMDLSQIFKELSSSSTHLPLHMIIFYWMEMLYAVKQIHENGVVHSDIKPANFIRVGGGLKLIDFGIASSIQSDMTSIIKDVQIGTLNYISPEALTNQSSSSCDSPSFGKPKYKVSYKSDVWSLGCILYWLVYKKAPFQHIVNQLLKMTVLANPAHTIEYPESKWVPQKLLNTIKNCLQYDIKSRPSVDELITECENIYF